MLSHVQLPVMAVLTSCIEHSWHSSLPTSRCCSPAAGGQAGGPAAGTAAPRQGFGGATAATSAFAAGVANAAQSLANRLAGRNLRGVNMLAEGLQVETRPSAARRRQ